MNNEIAYAKKLNDEYGTHSQSKLDELRKLDSKVKTPALTVALIIGIIGALVLGTGMCLAMKVIGDLFALGVVVGCVGIAICSVNFFIYKAVIKAGKKKYGAQILKLSDELLNKENN